MAGASDQDAMIRCTAMGANHLIPRLPCPLHQHKYTGTWKRTRAAVLARDNHQCVMCARPCPHPKHHHVHHISHDIPNRDAMSNLRTVCEHYNVGGQRTCKAG